MSTMQATKRIGWKCKTAGSSDPRFFAPEARMTVVRLHDSNHHQKVASGLNFSHETSRMGPLRPPLLECV